MLLFTVEFYSGPLLTIFTAELSEHYLECATQSRAFLDQQYMLATNYICVGD
jgi:hypothetical protein